ncbi:MAG: undecaprenyldiphospho-muramoylpentapeptide beta-N-acetylglucosaminyltransferase [Candidatus Omnitrophica bacterium]|nr:undecaprenyldiphospho-muramoylpentapeptide beta-N-acetylglucosaminyltransferase [Candidatus Omnitrophota bacterium]
MKILIASGGTGGHLFPAIRLAEELKARGMAEVLFVTSCRKQDSAILKEKNIRFCVSSVIPLQSCNILDVLNFGWRLVWSTIKSLFLLLSFRPQVVIGFGSYVSGPIVLLAALSRIKTVIHEQNVYPGKTNRALARFVDKIAVSFSETRAYLKRFDSKTVVSGNLIRQGLRKTMSRKDRFTILTMGGSQGAHTLNKLVPEAAGLINGDTKKDLEMIHISGARERGEVATAYNNKGIKNRVIAFTEGMSDIYNECDFVISRAGATTVSELLFLGKPSILVPYPHAGGHQRLNAKVLEGAGIAVLLEEEGLTAEVLRDRIVGFMDKAKLATMAKKTEKASHEDACDILIKEIDLCIRKKDFTS